MTLRDLLERVDYSSIVYDISPDNIYRKKFNCLTCGINYSFEYLIGKNTVDSACKVHPGFYTKGHWQCCGSAIYTSPPCFTNCHNTKFHLNHAQNCGIKYYTTSGLVYNNNVSDYYNDCVFQIPFTTWLKIMKKKYQRLCDIPIDEIQKSLYNIHICKNEIEFRNSFFGGIKNEKKYIINNGKRYKICKTIETTDERIIYVNTEDNDDSTLSNVSDDDDDDNNFVKTYDFTRRTIVSYKTNKF